MGYVIMGFVVLLLIGAFELFYFIQTKKYMEHSNFGYTLVKVYLKNNTCIYGWIITYRFYDFDRSPAIDYFSIKTKTGEFKSFMKKDIISMREVTGLEILRRVF